MKRIDIFEANISFSSQPEKRIKGTREEILEAISEDIKILPTTGSSELTVKIKVEHFATKYED